MIFSNQILARTLAGTLTLLIFAIAVTGRSLAAFAQPAIRFIEANPLSISTLLALILAFALYRYNAFVTRVRTVRYALIQHLTLVLAIAIHPLLVVATVEYMHLILYAPLGFLVRLSLTDLQPTKAIIIAFLLANGISLLDEFAQTLVPNRFFDLRDIGLNCLAAMIGIAAANPLSARRKSMAGLKN